MLRYCFFSSLIRSAPLSLSLSPSGSQCWISFITEQEKKKTQQMCVCCSLQSYYSIIGHHPAGGLIPGLAEYCLLRRKHIIPSSDFRTGSCSTDPTFRATKVHTVQAVSTELADCFHVWTQSCTLPPAGLFWLHFLDQLVLSMLSVITF